MSPHTKDEDLGASCNGRIDIEALEKRTGSGLSVPYDFPCKRSRTQAIGRRGRPDSIRRQSAAVAAGRLVEPKTLAHREDEFVFVLAGEVVLVTDDGEEVLRAGDCAGFKANEPNGHHLQNRSHRRRRSCWKWAVATARDGAFYSDIDMIAAVERVHS